jgi:hypothetical protein
VRARAAWAALIFIFVVGVFGSEKAASVVGVGAIRQFEQSAKGGFPDDSAVVLIFDGSSEIELRRTTSNSDAIGVRQSSPVIQFIDFESYASVKRRVTTKWKRLSFDPIRIGREHPSSSNDTGAYIELTHGRWRQPYIYENCSGFDLLTFPNVCRQP